MSKDVKATVPKYLEHTAFGARAKQKHPGLFSGNVVAATSIATMLPQRLVSRTPASDGSPGRITEPVEAGDTAKDLIANAPFACGSCAVYFEVEIEALAAPNPSNDFMVNVGIEKRYIGKGPLRTERRDSGMLHSVDDSDERSDFGEGPFIDSGSWTEHDDEDGAKEVEENRLFHYDASVITSTLDKKGVWNWVWKLSSGMASFTRGPLNYRELHLCEPLSSLPERPTRVGFMLDLASNEAVLTREGRVIAAHVLETKRMMSIPSELADLFVLVPTLTIQNARVRPIFGDGNLPNDGFLFDISSYVRAQTSLPALSKPSQVEEEKEELMQLILEYFAFYGYDETVNALIAQRQAEQGGDATPAVPSGSRLVLRKEIRRQISKGNIEQVYELLHIAGVKELPSDLRFKMDLHAFVQLVRTSANIDAVLEQGRLLFSKYNASSDASVRAKLEQVSGLLVSNDPTGPAHQTLYGPEATHELITAALGAVSEAEGGERSPRLINMVAETCYLLSRLAWHGNGTASMLAGQLAEQTGWY